jgi:tryptophan synthase alpha chain
MNRLDILFQQKQKNILSVYFTAGFPKLNDTETIVKALVANGADMIEIGMPFSDPMADGPVIQKASQTALANGMSIKLLFEQIVSIRKHTQIPILLMGYLNPVYRYGIERFCKKCAEVGVDGIIVPDLPLEEYKEVYEPIFTKYGIYNTFLVTPQTSESRIREIDAVTKGFIYIVSTFSTTGGNKALWQSEKYFLHIQEMGLKSKLMVGFGISSKETFLYASQFANGAIIGTAFVKALEESGEINDKVKKFMNTILQ